MQMMSHIAWLEVRHRVQILTFKKMERALEEVIRWSLGMNPYCIVQPDSPVASDKHRAKYLSLLLRRIEGLTASQAKWVVATYPTWGALCDAMVNMDANTEDRQVRTALDGMPEYIVGRLKWMAEEMGSFLRQLDREP
ncbi:hypothetical protein V5O48_006851 [Marasmius crinis-equi]|uniref:Uncharacterized protein n=1 Tax=Marasmius crinis-equi TaxID=585013 RepID=A0ABR3FI96_9AGAR